MAQIEFTEDAVEERVHPVNYENPKDPKSGKRYDIPHARGKRMEVTYASAIYWVNRGVARIVEASDEERAADQEKRRTNHARAGLAFAGAGQRPASPMVGGLAPAPAQ
jgi:hypothetical protein